MNHWSGDVYPTIMNLDAGLCGNGDEGTALPGSGKEVSDNTPRDARFVMQALTHAGEHVTHWHLGCLNGKHGLGCRRWAVLGGCASWVRDAESPGHIMMCVRSLTFM